MEHDKRGGVLHIRMLSGVLASLCKGVVGIIHILGNCAERFVKRGYANMEWQQIAIVFTVAFAVTYAMVPVSKRLAYRMGAIDYPSNRRVNTKPVPRCGGIAIFAGLVAGVFATFVGAKFSGWALNDLYVLQSIDYAMLYVGVVTLFTVGLVDDIVQLTAPMKFAWQVVACVIVALSGVTIGTVQSLVTADYLVLGWVDYPLTVLYFLVFVNITNLIDGLDGLASGMVIIVSAGLMYLCWMRGSYTLALACVALIATCLAFLRYNFFPASIFMGDCGALLLGLAVGVISVEGVVRTQSFVIMLVPLVIAGVPVVDTVSAIVRRLRSHESVGRADMDHIHHRLLRAGLSQKRSVLVLWLCTAALTFVGCGMEGMSGVIRWTALVVFAIVVFAVVWRFGLFKPVLAHHYDNKEHRAPQKSNDDGED